MKSGAFFGCLFVLFTCMFVYSKHGFRENFFQNFGVKYSLLYEDPRRKKVSLEIQSIKHLKKYLFQFRQTIDLQFFFDLTGGESLSETMFAIE